MNIPDALIRALALMASLALFYLAGCVYENEEKVLQSKIESWWLQFDDFRGRMLTRNAAFASVVATRSKVVLDRMFDAPVLSSDSIATAASLCLGCVGILEALGGRPVVPLATYAVICLFCSVAPVVWPAVRRFGNGVPRRVLIVLLCVAPFAESLFWLGRPGRIDDAAVVILAVVGLLIAIGLTLAVVSVLRLALTRIVSSQSYWVGVLLSTLFTLLGLVLLPFLAADYAWTGYEYTREHHLDLDRVNPQSTMLGRIFYWSALAVLFGGGAAAISAAVLALLVAIAGLMMLDLMAWPLASRLLYTLPRHRVIESKKTLYTLGAVLLGVAIHGTYGWAGLRKWLLGW